MYLHPDVPSYEQHIMAQDNILKRYPELKIVGAHLGSMEWSLEEVAKRLEKFPNFYIDLSGRFNHIFEQTLLDRNKVIDFFETYQSRILYGSDYFAFPYNSREWMKPFCKYFPQVYLNLMYRDLYRKIKEHWLFLSTNKVFKTEKMKNKPASPGHIEGLKLSKNIVDQIFYENTCCVYHRQR